MYTHKKSLGQHFLKDEIVIQKIIDVLKAETFTNLLEVESGAGALIKHLINFSVVDFKAVELGEEKVEYLSKNIHNCKTK